MNQEILKLQRVKKEISKFSASSDKHGSEQQVNAAFTKCDFV